MTVHAKVSCKGLTASVGEDFNIADCNLDSFAFGKSLVSGYVNSDHHGIKEFFLASKVFHSDSGIFPRSGGSLAVSGRSGHSSMLLALITGFGSRNT